MKVILGIIILAFLIFGLKISFSLIFGILYLFLTLGLSIFSISSFRSGDVEEGLKCGIPAALLIAFLLIAIF